MNRNSKKAFEDKCWEHCLHVHACRRLRKMYNLENIGCNKNCTAYVDLNDELSDTSGKTYVDYDGYTFYMGRYMERIVDKIKNGV